MARAFVVVATACIALTCRPWADGPRPLPVFEKRVIDPAFRSEGVTVFDVDRDGDLDIVTEELWYEAPSFRAHEIRTPRAWDPREEYAHCFGAFHLDVDRDGWEDLIVFGPPGEDASWCQNPRETDRHWTCHPIASSASGESPLLDQLFGAESRSLVMGIEPERELGVMTPGATVDAPWVMNAVTPRDFPQAARFEHGLGVGDVNGDGRVDILTGSGWIEQPEDRTRTPWPWHPVTLCPNDCAHMFVFDIDGDGLADIVGSSPHAYGVWWWKQERDAPEPVFQKHEIDRTISQTHAARFVDLDGDGLPELVTGKRWFAHFTADPGALEPALLVFYRFERARDGVRWVRHIIDDDSGVGSQFEIVDIDADGKPDVVVANKKGLALFRQR